MVKVLKNKRVVIFIFFVSLAIIVSFFHKRNIYIWAWERPEDFSFLEDNRNNITIVYYAGGIVLKGGELSITKRLNPLVIPDNLKTMPVVRIDNFNGTDAFTDDMMYRISGYISNVCNVQNIVGCQVDFDATVSEREVYEKLLTLVKNKIPKNIPLSITALVSWCDKYSWINKTQIDFAVPMFYRMGNDKNRIENGYTGQTFMKSPKCSKSIGVSLDEPLKNKTYIHNRDIYLFNPNSWDEKTYRMMIKKY